MFVGTIAFNIVASVDAGFLTNNSMAFFNDDSLSMFQTININNELLLKHVAFSRIKLILFIMCGCLTRYYKAWLKFAVIAMGITSGIIISCCAYSYGFIGVLVYIASIFPQWAAYIFAFVILVKMLSENKRDCRQMIVNFAVIVLLVVIGIYLETMINPFVIKWIYNLCVVL